MSQHVYPTTYNGRAVSVLMGWDRPLQGFFLVVDHEDSREVVYSNLRDPALVARGGLAESLTYFTRKLEELGLSVPAPMVEQIEMDAANNVGNRRVVYDLEGRLHEGGSK